MNVAKWLLLAIVALPIAELVVFIMVAASIGFGLALLMVLATSFAGGLLLRHAGGNHSKNASSAHAAMNPLETPGVSQCNRLALRPSDHMASDLPTSVKTKAAAAAKTDIAGDTASCAASKPSATRANAATPDSAHWYAAGV